MKTDNLEIKNFLKTVSNEMTTFMSDIDDHSLLKAKELIINCKEKGNRIHITGVGKPSYVAGYIASLLSSTGTPAYLLDATETIHGSAGQVVKGDVVIAISNSGETGELKQAILTLKKNGALIICVTREKNSWLSSHSDITLIAKITLEGDNLNKPPRCSVLAEMILLQTLSILLQDHINLTKEQYLQWHPGGSIGISIKNEL